MPENNKLAGNGTQRMCVCVCVYQVNILFNSALTRLWFPFFFFYSTFCNITFMRLSTFPFKLQSGQHYSP